MFHRSSRAFTLIEMLTVMAVIAILASLILSVNGYVQRKAAVARAEGEIAAMGAALEIYKQENGSYPRTTRTDKLDPKEDGNPGQNRYKNASLDLYVALSGDQIPGTTPSKEVIEPDSDAQKPDGRPETRQYFEFKPNMLKHDTDAEGKIREVFYIQDPFGNSYGYSTAGLKAEEDFHQIQRRNPTAPRPTETKGNNSTFDLWSTGGSTNNSKDGATGMPRDTKKWVKNW